MKALTLLPVLTLLAACAPTTQTQPTYTYEGEARFLLIPQKLRVTYTLNPGTHKIRGEYRNLSSGDTFTLTGTQLIRTPVERFAKSFNPSGASGREAGSGRGVDRSVVFRSVNETNGIRMTGPDGETLTAKIDPGDTPRLNASLLGFGISNVPLKASGTLSATVTASRLIGTLRVNGISYPVTLTRVR